MLNKPFVDSTSPNVSNMIIQKFCDNPKLYFWLCMGFIVILSMAGVFMNISGSLELDEPFSANLVNLPWAEMSKMFLQDPIAPVYYVCLKLWVSVFGDSEPAVRSLSVIFFALTIMVIGATAMRIDGTSAGIAGALLASISKVGLIFAGTARPYALLSLLTAISALLFFYILSLVRVNIVPGSRKIPLLAGFVIVNVFALLTHPIFIFLMIGFNAVAWIKPGRYFWIITLCNLLTLGIYLAVWGSVLIRTINLPAINWMEVPDLKDLIHGYVNLWGVTNTIVLSVVILYASISDFQTIRDFLLSRIGLVGLGILLTASLLPFLVSQYRPVFVDSRTPALFFPIACVTLALLIARFKPSWLTFGLLAILLGSVIVAAVFHRDNTGTERSPRASIQYVLENAECGDILISGGLSINETSYYLRRFHAPDCLEYKLFPAVMYDHPGWMDAPTLLEHSGELVTEAKVLVSELDQGHGNVWFFYESQPQRRPVLDILKDQLDREMVLVQTVDGYGAFFDSLLVYRSKR